MWREFDEEMRRMRGELDRLAREFSRIRLEEAKGDIDRSLEGLVKGPRELASRYFPSLEEPLTDVSETENEVIVVADLPGVKKEDVSVTATEDTLQISAQIRKEKEMKKSNYVRRERRYERFYRRLSLPAKVKPEGAKSKYNNGVLEVRLPKKEVTEGHSIEID